MKACIDRFVRGRDSIGKLIQYSDVFSQEYSDAVKASCPGARDARNLRVAAHRIEAIATPLGRAVLYLPALLTTAVAVAVKRKGRPEGKTAAEFLAWVDNERCLQLAMIADAGADGMAFKNFWDSETSDPARSNMEIETFRAKLQALWVDGKCIDMGFTQHVISTFKEPFHIPAAAVGSPKSLGGDMLQGAVLERCLGRMRCFVSMALACLQAEFPAWELLQSFSVFLLGDRGDRRSLIGEHVDQEACAQRKLRRLANLCGVACKEVCVQFTALRPLAMQYYRQSSTVGNVQAWANALQHVSDARYRRDFEISALRAVLCRYAACTGCTTQGQESSFSVQTTKILRPCRNQLTCSREQDEMKLCTDVKRQDADFIVKQAQRIWAELYGPVRRGHGRKCLRPRPVQKGKACNTRAAFGPCIAR
jgi:hypothetical protein